MVENTQRSLQTIIKEEMIQENSEVKLVRNEEIRRLALANNSGAILSIPTIEDAAKVIYGENEVTEKELQKANLVKDFFGLLDAKQQYEIMFGRTEHHIDYIGNQVSRVVNPNIDVDAAIEGLKNGH